MATLNVSTSLILPVPEPPTPAFTDAMAALVHGKVEEAVALVAV